MPFHEKVDIFGSKIQMGFVLAYIKIHGSHG